MLGLRHFRGSAIDLFQGDLTTFVCDAMVNAANEALAGGGGVDGAIHRAGGPMISADCRQLSRCPPGEARLTRAGDLPCRHVIHAVGPIWQGGTHQEATILRSAYRSALQLAVEHKLQHLAFPSISTGAYGFPLDRAAFEAMDCVRSVLEAKAAGTLRRITFVLFDQDSYLAYQRALFHTFPESEEASP